MGYELGTSYEKLRSYGELLLADETRYDAQLANNLKA
jgi:hypothetical protein